MLKASTQRPIAVAILNLAQWHIQHELAEKYGLEEIPVVVMSEHPHEKNWTVFGCEGFSERFYVNEVDIPSPGYIRVLATLPGTQLVPSEAPVHHIRVDARFAAVVQRIALHITHIVTHVAAV
jgi:hypothetical protein